jgi:ubiquitin carboxyl-terminal hydrolase 8
MKDMWLKSDGQRIVQPGCFKKSISTFAPQFSGNRQHDAQELLAFLLDGIHEDLNRVKKKPFIEDKDCDGTNDEEDAIEAWRNYLQRNRSLVVDLFQGQFRNTCICKTCGHKNIRFEPSMYLSLPISDSCRTLEDCLDIYLEEDELTGENQWYCEKCKKHTDATKKTDLWILPPILIVHLKRFKYDDFGRAGRKNEAALKYPITQWDLSRRVKSQGGGTPLYDLYAVSNHLGGLGGGHYTAYALNRFDEYWYEFNDTSYRRIDPKETFETSSSPYLLFYNRVVANDDPSSLRGLMIRRQSVSRPELWPHAQVREGQFRDFRRSSMMHIKIHDDEEEKDPMSSNGDAGYSNGDIQHYINDAKAMSKPKKKKKSDNIRSQGREALG